MGAKLGQAAVLHLKVSTTYTAVPNCKDVTLNMIAAEADASTRGSGGWKAFIEGLKEATVDWEMIYDTSDTLFAAFMAAFMNSTVVDMAIMDGPYATAGSQGLKGSFMVVKAEKKEPLTEAQSVAFSVKPYYATTPTWYTAS